MHSPSHLTLLQALNQLVPGTEWLNSTTMHCSLCNPLEWMCTKEWGAIAHCLADHWRSLYSRGLFNTQRTFFFCDLCWWKSDVFKGGAPPCLFTENIPDSCLCSAQYSQRQGEEALGAAHLEERRLSFLCFSSCQWDSKGPHSQHCSAKPQLSHVTAWSVTGEKSLPRNVKEEGKNWEHTAGNMLQRIERLGERAGERKLSLWFLPDVSFIFYQPHILPGCIIKI